MITSTRPFAMTEDEAEAIGTWAFAAMIVRSATDKAITPLTREAMERFRARGIQHMDVEVAVFTLANTRALFDRAAVGSTYIYDTLSPDQNAVALFFLHTIVVVVGTGEWSNRVRRTRHVNKPAVAVGWPWQRDESGWPTHSTMLDAALMPSLGITDVERSMFVPPSVPRGRISRALIRDL
ncbi:hypothetical protein PU630_15400 [Microbacterium horticulturae]|uniref:Uncharacterized protein n=1 Tax=Microbacterium horticulturae TaxID=3028316 RepID=A0ABY8C060_9MICO|nr:hypothetical protein [Microbacterium sp. KACC 23027]WEG08610.1 hypothetical protein PU630_15400 [Microbacterium sp. KACC 23027]